MGTIWIARLGEIPFWGSTVRFLRILRSFCLRTIASHLIWRMIMLLLSDHLTLSPLPWMAAVTAAPSATYETASFVREPAFRSGPVVCCWTRQGDARRLEALWQRR